MIMSTEFKNYDALKQCKLFLLDMDGTLYLGDSVIDGAIDFVSALRLKDIDFAFMTNNSSRDSLTYVNRLRRLGFHCERDDVYTSCMAVVQYLRENFAGQKVYPVCTRAFREELLRGGIEFSDQEADIVLVGFDTELTYDKLDRAVHFLRRGAKFIAANPDFVCPVAGGEVMPDCGCICAFLTAASGKTPFYIGKPNRMMVDIISKATGIANSEICCIGDRLYTDIAVARNAGAVSVLVMSGETNEEMLKGSDILPDYKFENVGELLKIL